jgi:hypothetical protein
LGFFLGRCGAGNAVSIPAEGFELVDEFVDDVPGPEVRGRFDLDGPVGVEDIMEERAVVVIRLKPTNMLLVVSVSKPKKNIAPLLEIAKTHFVSKLA